MTSGEPQKTKDVILSLDHEPTNLHYTHYTRQSVMIHAIINIIRRAEPQNAGRNDDIAHTRPPRHAPPRAHVGESYDDLARKNTSFKNDRRGNARVQLEREWSPVYEKLRLRGGEKKVSTTAVQGSTFRRQGRESRRSRPGFVIGKLAPGAKQQASWGCEQGSASEFRGGKVVIYVILDQ